MSEFDGWGCSVWYFEVGDDGPVLRYGAGHEDDQFRSPGSGEPLMTWTTTRATSKSRETSLSGSGTGRRVTADDAIALGRRQESKSILIVDTC
jgi:hypothetical protein